ncbi:ABC transporter substrate-binding protein [Candidimonas sp. SYP-B2681]|uniref:ABC transporter substrate-binding protein n=1 Tax=Candidimonas sp. SYP-B2681 TaxID=2497686 RepID=UPI000F87CB6A|nr:ABC transporter substrate-binding protein [Candidimonas sp. SYP-B2681]RTZ44614.1 ABC transporter substrate-binding protein [Candidimonas sp. SYP-B2681]
MEPQFKSAAVSRRAVLQLAAAAGLAQLTPPFIIKARGEESVKLGLDNPLTGTYAATGKNELTGCQLAIEQINAKGGILGRPAELLIEDSTSGDAGTAVQKARKLIDRDKVNFLLGNVNSGLSLAMAQVSNEKGVLHVVPGGHTDAVTGTTCHWNVFRVCNTTRMLTNAIAKTLMDSYGKKMYFITSDYAFGHTLQEGYDANLKQFGGTKLGEDLTPLGTTDFSSYLIKAQATNPDVIVFLMNGEDLLNALKQAVQFGLDKRIHLAGANTELEVLEGLPPEARIGDWVAEWYHIQPGVPHVDEFVAAIKKKTGRVPTARTWFGFVGTWTCALAANKAQSLEAVKMAKALQGLELPPEVGLMPDVPFYRANQNQLIGSLYVGHAQAKGSEPDDLFHVDKVVKGKDVAGTVEESGCKMTWPA